MRGFLLCGIAAVALSVVPAPAKAADIPVKAPRVAAVIYNWTGFYIAGNVGYSWGRANSELTGSSRVQVFRTAGPDLVFDSGTLASTLSERANVNGWLGGAQAGYNVQSSNWVYGLEADFQWTGQRGELAQSIAIPAFAIPGDGVLPAQVISLSESYRLRWFGTVRGRLGILASERLLLYGTGGLAYGQLDTTFGASSSLLGSIATSVRQTRLGWTAGAGGEAAIGDRWTAKLEYLYVDLGTFDHGSVAGSANLLNTPVTAFNTVLTFSGSARTRFTDHILRVGLNYRFGGPVVAAY